MARFEKIVVAIHGVGDQSRSETIRAVAAQFGARMRPPLATQPLGYFSVDGAARVKVSGLDLAGCNDPECHLLEKVGFAEVYWADIPREVVKGGYTLEDTKAWGHTIVSRAEALYRRGRHDPRLTGADFRQAAGVVEEIVESVEVIENFSFVAAKMGLFKFDVAPLLRDYVDDVQVVAEFPVLRERIVARFHRTMACIVQQFTQEDGSRPELYIVAHSEGTVLSFIALLQALARLDLPDPEAPDELLPMDWVEQVRGYMTIGSPIDKHIVLWDGIWKQFDNRPWRKLPQPIDWRNYYDYGDPVGFQLDTARWLLDELGCEAFDFKEDERGQCDHDIGFARYPFPGKAHVDYWKDPVVFGHFIGDVVLKQAGEPPAKPGDCLWPKLTSYGIPYGLALALHLLAVFLLFKGLESYVPWNKLGIVDLSIRVVALGALTAAITLAGRVPRLVTMDRERPWDWFLAAVSTLLVFATALLAQRVGSVDHPVPIWGGYGPDHLKAVLGAGAVLLVLASHARWIRPKRGRTVLLGFGFVVAVGFAAVQFWPQPADLRPDIHWGPVWTLLLALAAFLYLWWLGLLVFDLTFIWHRYIRHALAHDSLHKWRKQAPTDHHKPKGSPAGAMQA